MATFDAALHQAVLPEQQDLVDHPEHCCADVEPLAAIGRACGQQVRIWPIPPDGRPLVFALYTVSQTRDEDPHAIVRMGRGGKERLGPTEAFTLLVDSVVPNPGLSDAEAEERGEFVERLLDNGTHGLIAIAPHGGDIERHTDGQARRVADRLSGYGVSAWWCLGFGADGGGASRLLHITSTEIHEKSFPALESVIGRGFGFAVAFHGFRDDGVLVGGRAPLELKTDVALSIEAALHGTDIPVRVAGPDDVLGGDSPRNIVNRLTDGSGGVHIEQSLSDRSGHAEDIADAVADVFAARLSPPPATPSRAGGTDC